MMFNKTPSQKEIVNLLSKLKDRTPGYPSDLLAARKAAFLNQAITIKFEGPRQGGKGGGDGGSNITGGAGGSGTLGGMSAAQGILLQAVIGVWIIAGMLAAAYVFRDQIIDLLQDNGIVVEATQAPFIDSPESVVVTPATESPLPEVPPTEATSSSAVSPSVTPAPDALSEGEPIPESSPDGQGVSENPSDSKSNQGLHLGQTPGAPDTPNQDKEDNPNKPDKPDKKK